MTMFLRTVPWIGPLTAAGLIMVGVGVTVRGEPEGPASAAVVPPPVSAAAEPVSAAPKAMR